VPRGLRGIYVLYAEDKKHEKYNVMYIGMARARVSRGGIRNRLFRHSRSSRKGHLWSHFSIFAVWDNIRDEEIAELEGLFRHLYRYDAKANILNVQRRYKPMRKIRDDKLQHWKTRYGL